MRRAVAGGRGPIAESPTTAGCLAAAAGGSSPSTPHGGAASAVDDIRAVLLPAEQLGRGDHAFGAEGWKKAMLRLYRTVLRCHAVFLPHDAQRRFGDQFVRSEFRSHRTANEHRCVLFYQSWADYCVQLAAGVTQRDLSPSEWEMLSPEQKEKLLEVRRRATRRAA